MEVRALVAVPNYAINAANSNAVTVHKIPIQPPICDIGCSCFESFQKGVSTPEVLLHPFENQANHRTVVLQKCCGAQDCLCRRNMFQQAYLLSLSPVKYEKSTETPNQESERNILYPTMIQNQNQFYRVPQSPNQFKKPSNDRLDETSVLSSSQDPQHQLRIAATRNTVDIQRLQSNPLNLIDEYAKRSGMQGIKTSSQASSSVVEPQPVSKKTSETQELIVGGVTIHNKYKKHSKVPYFSPQPEVTKKPTSPANAQLQLIKTVCSTQNSFLPNFKTNRREHSFGEHKLPDYHISQIKQQQAFQPYGNPKRGLNGRILSPQRNASKNTSSPSAYTQPQIKSLCLTDIMRKQDDVQKQTEYLNRLVKDKPKLSNLVKDTINREHLRRQTMRTQYESRVRSNSSQGEYSISPEYVNNQTQNAQFLESFYQYVRPNTQQETKPFHQRLLSNETLHQAVDLIAPLQVEQSLSPDILIQVVQQETPEDTQTKVINFVQQQQRSVVMVSQTTNEAGPKITTVKRNQERNATEAGEPFLIRQGTEEDGNYLKYVVNEMKPNYLGQQIVPLGSASPPLLMQPLFKDHHPIQIGSGSIQQFDLSQSDENNLDGGNKIEQNRQQIRAQSQAVGKRSSIIKELIKTVNNEEEDDKLDIIQNNQAQQSFSNNVGSKLFENPQPPKHRSISQHDEVAAAVPSPSNKNRASSGTTSLSLNRKVLSERQSIDDSITQYRQIKFKLLIMKTPDSIQKKKKARYNRPETRQDSRKGGNTTLSADDGISRVLSNPISNGGMSDLNELRVINSGRGLPIKQQPSANKNEKRPSVGTTKLKKSELKITSDINQIKLIPAEEIPQNGSIAVVEEIKQKESIADKVSQETIYASSGAPLASKFESINASKQRHSGQLRVKSMKPQRIVDRAQSGNQLDLSQFNSNDEEMERNFEEFLAQHTTLRPRDMLADGQFDFKSGGEAGGNGLFSSHLTEHHCEETESENKTIVRIRKSAYQVMQPPPKSSLSRREANSRWTNRRNEQLNEDIKEMIIQGGSKARHYRDVVVKTRSPKQQYQEVVPVQTPPPQHHNKTVIPTVEKSIKIEEEKNDTIISFESSPRTNNSPKNIIHVVAQQREDKITDLEKSQEGIDNYLGNSHYLMRYLDQNTERIGALADFKNTAQTHIDNTYPTLSDFFNSRDFGIAFKQIGNNIKVEANYQQPKSKSGKRRILQIQTMNQQMRPKTGDLGQGLLQGRPIMPLKQLIRDNFQQFALENLQKIEDKRSLRKAQQDFMIKRNKNNKAAPAIIQDDEEDIRLSKYIWSTLNQLKQEGYPIDMNLFSPKSRDSTVTPSPPKKQNEDTKAFSNKRIKHAAQQHQIQIESSEKQRTPSTAVPQNRMILDKNKKKSTLYGPNADLQFMYMDDQNFIPTTLRDQKKSRLSVDNQQQQVHDKKITENSISGRNEDKNLNIISDTQNSNIGSHRNSYTNPVAQAIYAEDMTPFDHLSPTTPAALQPVKKPKSPDNNSDDEAGNKPMLEKLEDSKLPASRSKNFTKTLPFDLHLMRLNSPPLPPQLSQYARNIKAEISEQLTKHTHDVISIKQLQQSYGGVGGASTALDQISESGPAKLRRNIIINHHARKADTTMGEKSEENLARFIKKRGSEIMQGGGVMRSENNLESNLEAVSRRPSTISKLPHGIEGVIITHYDRIQSSHETNTLSEAMKNTIFFNRHPALASGQLGIPPPSVMSMRPKQQKYIASTSFNSPLKSNELDALNAYTTVPIKDLSYMRAKEQVSDYTTAPQKKPLPTWGLTPNNNKTFTSRPNTEMARTPAILGGRRTLNSTTPAAFHSLLSSPKQSSIQQVSIIIKQQTNKSQQNRQATQYLKIKRGRVLEDQTSGRKQSNGIKIIG